jgi:MoxR-like ATPase
MDAGSFVRMLQTEVVENPTPVLSWLEVEAAQAEAAKVTVPEAVLATVQRIDRRVSELRIQVSPRRYRAAMGVVRASAWLDGRDEATGTDLLVLKDILWLFPDQVVSVGQLVDLELRNSVSPVALLLRDVRKLGNQVDDVVGLSDKERHKLAEELGPKLAAARKELEVLERHSRSSTTRAVRRLLDDTDRLVLKRLFQSDPEAVVT